jgi:topoisomerase-4 subunit A
MSSNDTLLTNNNGEGHLVHLSGMFENWFLDYSSYVILERAVPHIHDGLKPVQRRLLHSLKEMDDGRFNKVANVIGHTMKYHPHGDASIGDALVNMGQKNLLIDTQGNWGNILTGDSAAASRYIEARLSKFALDVVFNPKTTNWRMSYDGRSKEPVTLPMKFPLVLAHGAEGIAVGLACKILSHNFIELIDASIDILRGRKPEVYPDFTTGGLADFSRYNDGIRGGKIRVRAKISQLDKKTLIITEIPCETTTSALMDSIVAASEKGKIKIKKIEDNTAENVEILVHLAPGISPDQTIDALYAFTDCEKSISPNACIIEDDKPRFVTVTEILKISTRQTVDLVKRELEIERDELEEKWHFASLEKIFIEKKIYRNIEDAETWEAVIKTIHDGLKPYKKKLKREITDDDVTRLTEIKIKRISKFDSKKADNDIKEIEDELDLTHHHLANLTEYVVAYFRNLKEKYGKGRERKTEIRSFETIVAAKVAVANAKLYYDKEDGFAGTSLKKADFISECSDLDDIIVFYDNGTFKVSKVNEKTFVGKNVLHLNILKKDDRRTTYNMIYMDGANGPSYMKRFNVMGITRDKEYDLTRGSKGSKVNYFTVNPNGESEIVSVFLKPLPKLKKLLFEVDFGSMAIKNRSAQGNLVTKYPIRKVVFKEKGTSSLGGLVVWFDEVVQRLNTDKRGIYLGIFKDNDRILVITKDGTYRTTGFELSNHYDEDEITAIKKFEPADIVSAVYYNDEGEVYVKRFNPLRVERKVRFIDESEKSKLLHISMEKYARIEIIYKGTKSGTRANEEVQLHEFIAVKGDQAKGKRLTAYPLKSINNLEPTIVDPEDNSGETEVDMAEGGIPDKVSNPIDLDLGSKQTKMKLE